MAKSSAIRELENPIFWKNPVIQTPLESLKTPPKPAKLGFPLAAPSVLILMELLEGESQPKREGADETTLDK